MNRTNKTPELVIRDYMSKLSEPMYGWRKDRFEQCSYTRWATKEVLRCIREQKNTPPIIVVEDFIRRMDVYACANPDNSYIFSIAHDVGEDILDIFLTMGDPYTGYLD